MGLRERANWLSREEIVSILETEACIACYGNETTDDLREALVVNVEDGTIPEYLLPEMN